MSLDLPHSVRHVGGQEGSIAAASLAARPRIVHVTESFGSGTAAAIRDYVRNYSAADHHLVYSARTEAAVGSAEFAGFVTVTELPSGHYARIRFLRVFIANSDRPLIIHAHSSKAGVYVRMSVRKSATPIVYTPHCYSFERLDVAWPIRQCFRAVEWLLSFNTTCYASCSPREGQLSRWPISRPRVAVVPNVGQARLARQMDTHAHDTIRIAGNGRLGNQKDHTFFADAVASVTAQRPDVRAVWIGGGESAHVAQLRARGIEVTGWVSRSEALAVLASCDVYLHTALWEGFPISILEASAAGLPVIARNRPYLSGMDMPVVIDHPHQLCEALLGMCGERPRRIAVMETKAALSDNSDEMQQLSLRTLYAPYIGASCNLFT
ncbi:glycosyltransferase [[Mycobacterium] manitobense]|uniref:glycosyltransferase n=1 Tax=[Mycobacterium] manitobense TaxID=190147 RepID=UPI0021F398FB|nr:glycosyltransferase [[Mycobacterium] manitobense]